MVPEVRIAGVATRRTASASSGQPSRTTRDALDVRVRGHGAELERAGLDADLAQPGHPVQGDQAIGLHEPEPDHRDERRPARDEPRLAVESPERLDRVGERLGLDQTERMQAHAYLVPATASTASMILV